MIRDVSLCQLPSPLKHSPRPSTGQFAAVLREQQEARSERERLRLRMLTADPFDVEAQRLMAEEIRQSNIEANMEAAMEHHPESFGMVVMLYVNCRVNGFPVKAFIDSGQSRSDIVAVIVTVALIHPEGCKVFIAYCLLRTKQPQAPGPLTAAVT